MLFPDQRIGRDGEKLGPIILLQRPKPKLLALQGGLQIETHCDVKLLVPYEASTCHDAKACCRATHAAAREAVGPAGLKHIAAVLN